MANNILIKFKKCEELIMYNSAISQGTITRLEVYDKLLHKTIENYILTDEQLKFTAHPLVALKACENNEGRIPIVISSGDEIAGFFVLHGWDGVKEYSENQNALLLRAYSIHNSSQGKGIAKLSLQLLPDFVREHFPEVNEIILAVNHENKKAQYVYKTAGFKDTGIRSTGRNGELFILFMNLNETIKKID
jgi:RimJ/RimL family protein N-acetyltransferase